MTARPAEPSGPPAEHMWNVHGAPGKRAASQAPCNAKVPEGMQVHAFARGFEGIRIPSALWDNKKRKLFCFFLNSEGLKVSAYLQAPCRRYARACLQASCVGPRPQRVGAKSVQKWVRALARRKNAPKNVGHSNIFPKSPRPQPASLGKSQARASF